MAPRNLLRFGGLGRERKCVLPSCTGSTPFLGLRTTLGISLCKCWWANPNHVFSGTQPSTLIAPGSWRVSRHVPGNSCREQGEAVTEMEKLGSGQKSVVLFMRWVTELRTSCPGNWRFLQFCVGRLYVTWSHLKLSRSRLNMNLITGCEDEEDWEHSFNGGRFA